MAERVTWRGKKQEGWEGRKKRKASKTSYSFFHVNILFRTRRVCVKTYLTEFSSTHTHASTECRARGAFRVLSVSYSLTCSTSFFLCMSSTETWVLSLSNIHTRNPTAVVRETGTLSTRDILIFLVVRNYQRVKGTTGYRLLLRRCEKRQEDDWRQQLKTVSCLSFLCLSPFHLFLLLCCFLLHFKWIICLEGDREENMMWMTCCCCFLFCYFRLVCCDTQDGVTRFKKENVQELCVSEWISESILPLIRLLKLSPTYHPFLPKILIKCVWVSLCNHHLFVSSLDGTSHQTDKKSCQRRERRLSIFPL